MGLNEAGGDGNVIFSLFTTIFEGTYAGANLQTQIPDKSNKFLRTSMPTWGVKTVA